jgi:hypothetical protein
LMQIFIKSHPKNIIVFSLLKAHTSTIKNKIARFLRHVFKDYPDNTSRRTKKDNDPNRGNTQGT